MPSQQLVASALSRNTSRARLSGGKSNSVIEVAQMLNAPVDMVAVLTAAQTETQFHSALQSVKDAIPESLKIKGQNPLTLLHTALSDGLHARVSPMQYVWCWRNYPTGSDRL